MWDCVSILEELLSLAHYFSLSQFFLYISEISHPVPAYVSLNILLSTINKKYGWKKMNSQKNTRKILSCVSPATCIWLPDMFLKGIRGWRRVQFGLHKDRGGRQQGSSWADSRRWREALWESEMEPSLEIGGKVVLCQWEIFQSGGGVWQDHRDKGPEMIRLTAEFWIYF